MVEYLFPIFGFGVVITGIVAKGIMTAAEVARNHPESEGRGRPTAGSSPFLPIANEVGRFHDHPQSQPHS